MDLSPTNLSDLWALNGPEAAARSSFYAMGHSVRTDKWRYTECKSLCRRGLLLAMMLIAWLALVARAGVHWNAAADGPDWSQPLLGRELYDHQSLGLSNADFVSHHEIADIWVAFFHESSNIVVGRTPSRTKTSWRTRR